MISKDESFGNFNPSSIDSGVRDTGSDPDITQPVTHPEAGAIATALGTSSATSTAGIRSGPAGGSTAFSEKAADERSTTEQIQEKAEQLRQEARSKAEQLRQGAQATYEQARQGARRVLDDVKQQGVAEVEGRKRYMADEVGGFASALHTTARQLNEQNQSVTARYIEQAAGNLEQFAQGIRNQDLGRVVRQVEDFARRQPALFLGGAVAVGFLLARFLKSSAARRREQAYRAYAGRGYRTGYARRYAAAASRAQPLEREARDPASALNVNTSSVGIPETTP